MLFLFHPKWFKTVSYSISLYRLHKNLDFVPALCFRSQPHSSFISLCVKSIIARQLLTLTGYFLIIANVLGCEHIELLLLLKITLIWGGLTLLSDSTLRDIIMNNKIAMWGIFVKERQCEADILANDQEEIIHRNLSNSVPTPKICCYLNGSSSIKNCLTALIKWLACSVTLP